MSAKLVRVGLNIPEALKQSVGVLAGAKGMSMTDVIIKGMRLLLVIEGRLTEGGSLILRDKDGKESELVIF